MSEEILFDFSLSFEKRGEYWYMTSNTIPGVLLVNEDIEKLLKDVKPVIKCLLEENSNWTEEQLKIFEVNNE